VNGTQLKISPVDRGTQNHGMACNLQGDREFVVERIFETSEF